jgi:hypothetical protein
MHPVSMQTDRQAGRQTDKPRISPSSCKVHTTMCAGAMWFWTLLLGCYKVHHHTKWLSSDWHEPLLLIHGTLPPHGLQIHWNCSFQYQLITELFDRFLNTLPFVEISCLCGTGPFPACSGTWRFITQFTNTHNCSLYWARSIQSKF